MRSLQKSISTLFIAGASLLPLLAYAGSGDEAEVEVRRFLGRYEQVLSEGQVDAMPSVYVHFPPEHAAKLRDHFTRVVQPLDVDIDILELRVLAPDTVQVKFDRTDTFVDRTTEERLVKRIRLKRDILRGPTGWRLLNR